MGILSMVESRSSLQNPDRWFIRAFGGNDTRSGILVDHDSALESTAVFAGVRLLAETLASVPVKLYERMERGKREATDHPVHRLIHDEPNEEQTPLEFYEMIQGFAVTSGTGYAQIIREEVRGRVVPVEMWPLVPYRVRPERTASGALRYRVRLPLTDQDTYLPAEDVLAVRGFSRDGLVGVDVIDKMREAIGLGLAAERFESSFFGNGAQPGGILKSTKKLSPEARNNIKKSWQERHGGPNNAQKFALLEEGLEWMKTTVDPKEAQAVELRTFQINEVARILNIPPHMLKELTRSTNNNIEQQSLEFVIYTMRPWYERWSQALEKKLLLPSQRRKYFIEHVIEGLLRGDIKSRSEAYQIARQSGWMTANEIRERENMNAIEGGDELLVQVNMIPARMLPDLYASDSAEDKGDDDAERAAALELVRRRQERAYTGLFMDAAGRAVRAEVGAARKALKRSNGGADAIAFRKWIDSFYEEHISLIRRSFLPALQTWGQVVAMSRAAAAQRTDDEVAGFLVRYADELARREAERSAEELRALLAEPEVQEESISSRLDAWETDRPAEIASREVRAVAIAIEQFITDPRRN